MRIVVLASGSGTNAQEVMDATTDGRIDARVVGVVTNVPDAGVVARAHARGVETVVLPPFPGEVRRDYDTRLADRIAPFEPELVVLAGWMRILTSAFLDRYPTINLHPALPGQLPGTDAIARAYGEARRGQRTSTGVMVHWVPDEGVDDGPVIVAEDVPIHPGDTLADLEARVHATEHRLLVDAIIAVGDSPQLRRG